MRIAPNAVSNAGVITMERCCSWFLLLFASLTSSLMFAARGAGAVTLSGTIRYSGSLGLVSSTHPIVVVMHDNTNLHDMVDTFAVVANGGAFMLSAPGAGTYYLHYFLDLQAPGVPYGVFQNRLNLPGDPISVPQSGLSGLSLNFDDAGRLPGLGGTVTYSGSLGAVSSDHPLIVVGYDDPGLTMTVIHGYQVQINGGRYQLSSIHMLDPSTYYVRAFLDLNGNSQLDAGEPFQIYQNKCSGMADPVLSGFDQPHNIDFSFGDESVDGCNATSTPTPSPCVGDCNGDEQPTVDEILTIVNMALGNGGSCPNGVAAGTIPDVSIIVQAVNHALNGCGG